MAELKVEIPPNVSRLLEEARDEGHRVIVFTCGITGSGKSTLSRAITTSYPTYARLSIDKTVFQQHGAYAIDYPASQYSQLQESAEESLRDELKDILSEGKRDAVLDLSFYSREFRDGYRELVEREGRGAYKVVLVVFRVRDGEDEEEVLWRRVVRRKEDSERMRTEVDGRAMEGMSVGRETLKMYIEGFEWPNGEGEVVINVE